MSDESEVIVYDSNPADASSSHRTPANILSHNPTVDNLDEDLIEKLRGDRMGDTAYSESFVLRTLTQLKDLKWTQQLEDDLCFLWDMTEEKAVCNYLVSVNFPVYACLLFCHYHEHKRFRELLIGILANILCVTDVPNAITSKEIDFLVSLLEVMYTPLLVQVVRSLHAIIHNSGSITIFDDNSIKNLCFILSSSTDIELLLSTLRLLSRCTNECRLPPELVDSSFVKCVSTAYQQLKSDEECSTINLDVALRDYVDIVFNICIYIDNRNVTRLYDELSETKITNDENFIQLFVNEMINVLQNKTDSGELLPLTKEFRLYIDTLTFIFRILSVRYNTRIFMSILRILYLVIRGNDPNIEEVCECLCYFVHVECPKKIIDDLVECVEPKNYSDLKMVMEKIHQMNYLFEFEYKDNFRFLYTVVQQLLH